MNAAFNSENYLKAANLCLEIEDMCRKSLAGSENDKTPRSIYEGTIHIAEARRNIALYKMEKKAENQPGKISENLTRAIYEFKQAIRVYNDEELVNGAYKALLSLYGDLVEFLF
jgi:hypothetical protein